MRTLRRPFGLAALLVTQTAGCSFLAISAPRPDGVTSCPNSYFAPGADTAAAALLAASTYWAITVATDPEGSNSRQSAGRRVAIVAGVASLGSAASAVYGFYKVPSCKDAFRLRKLRHRQQVTDRAIQDVQRLKKILDTDSANRATEPKCDLPMQCPDAELGEDPTDDSSEDSDTPGYLRPPTTPD